MRVGGLEVVGGVGEGRGGVVEHCFCPPGYQGASCQVGVWVRLGQDRIGYVTLG